MQPTVRTTRKSALSIRNLLILTAAGLSLLAPASAHAQALNSVARGWYQQDGLHEAANDNYVAGNIGGEYFHNWFLFDVPSLRSGQQYSAAVLRLYTANVESSETYALRDYTGSLTDLVSEDGNGNGIAIFNDLATGSDYASINLSTAESGTVIDIPLSSSALADINAAAGGQFALGGIVSTLDADDVSRELIFGMSGSYNASDGQTQLILSGGGGGGGGAGSLTSVAAPEPAALSLLALAGLPMAGIVIRRRRGAVE
jgi:hypothetical protein